MQVGIDAIGLAVPPLTLDLASLARARGVEPAKFVEGLGTTRIAIPPVDEDTVTLAVRAAKSALDRAGVSPSDIGLCVVGTETAVDHSKPVTAFVHGLLGLPSGCRIYETKHACYGATAGLQTALDWIRSGSARGKKALIIGSDIARYGLRTPGEPTQGAGAVALIVSESPRLITFETGQVGTFAHDVNDFWRPLYSKDAVVDGHYSVTCYLEALEGAYRAYVERSTGVRGDAPFSDRFAAIAYHVPYGKMAIKAHRHVRALEGDTSRRRASSGKSRRASSCRSWSGTSTPALSTSPSRASSPSRGRTSAGARSRSSATAAARVRSSSAEPSSEERRTSRSAAGGESSSRTSARSTCPSTKRS
jgi:hydroxymethylglutaryl-CoA synthase